MSRKNTRPADHLSSSLTDLMTSLMVIFVLLLVAKLNNQAGQRAAMAAELERRLANHMRQYSQDHHIGRDRDDPNTLVISIPDTLLSFATQDYHLKPEGQQYLRQHIPAWAKILCAGDIRPNLDTIIVEGHSDRTQWQGSTYEESKEKNLLLSQQRSMAVVSSSLEFLKSDPSLRDCFLEKLSATGRGEEDPIDTSAADSPKNRRVAFRIRLRPEVMGEVAERLREDLQR
ncbi:MAG: OmpA family protein [Bryobacteraceae bacterium]|nr:OmpA family protein [Bryobacteraceae bacterium]